MVPFRLIFRILPLAVLVSCSPAPTVKIGFLAGLTGSGSELGTVVRRALELSVRDLNRSGGIRGRRVELVAADDGNDPAKAVRALDSLRRDGVVAVIGPVASTVVGAVLPYLNQHRIPTVSPTVSAPSVSGRDDWFFRVMAANPDMGRILGDYAVQTRLLDVAVLLDTSNRAYSEPILAEFRGPVEAAGGRVRLPVTFAMGGDHDYRGLASALGQAQAYLVLADGYDTAQVGQALALAGRGQPILATAWAMTPEVISLGGRQVERTVFASLYDSQSLEPQWLAFCESYRTLYGEEPGFAAVYARDAFTLLTQALAQAPDTSPETIRSALASSGRIQGLQTPFQLDPFGDVSREFYLQTVRDGRFTRSGL